MTQYKDITVDEYDELFAKAKFKMRPMWHQYAALAKSLNEDLSHFGVFNGVGTGKTLTALYLAQVWKCKKILVVCPYSAFPAWDKNIIEGTDWTHQFLEGSSKDRIEKLEEDKDIYIINFEGLKTIYGSQQEMETIEDDGSITRRKPWAVDIQSMVDGFDCLIIDEFHKCGNFTTMSDINVQTQIINTLVSRAKCVFGLTGTPFKAEMLNIWALFYILDRGRTFGNNFFTYRNKYFYKYWYSFKLRSESKKEDILDKVAQLSISFAKHECIDLPPLTREILSVKKTSEQARIECGLILKGVLKVEGHCTDELTGSVRVQKMKQVQGGFVYLTEDDERSTIRVKSNKPKVLKEFIQSCYDEKIVIFHQYVEEGRIIEEVCKKLKIKFASIRSETKDKNKEYKKFVEDDDCLIMIAHPDAAKESYDMSCSSILVFYSFAPGFLQYDQCVGRIERFGQERNMTEFFMVTEDGLDEVILASLDNNTDFMDAAMRYIQEYDR